MIQLPGQSEERRRLAMIASLGLAGEAPDHSFSALAALAADLTATSTGLVSLVESDRVSIAGAFGMGAEDLDRWDSFCGHVLIDPSRVLWVEDAREDVRFRASRYVVGAPFVRFYAGAPLVVNGCVVGALCALDSSPRAYDAVVAARLTRVADACMAELTERHRTQAMRQALVASADALVDCDAFGRIMTWSAGAEALFGHSREDAIGSDICMIIPAEHRAGHQSGMARWRDNGAARLGRRLELPAIRKDGSSLDIELWMSVSHEGGAPCIHANIRDISERKRQARDLAAATARAEDANRSKTAFLANMSHELRTPLNGVTAGAGLLATAGLTPKQLGLVDIISSASEQLGRLIDDLLDLTRIESGALVLDPSATDLRALLDDVCRLARLRADEKGVAIALKIEAPDDGLVNVDKARLKQVLGNLLSNAIKFTSEGQVSLSLQRSGDRCRFEVQDTGIGFEDHHRALIFERFHQADPTITRRFGGTGLGLAICRDIVEAMGGVIDCASRPGVGSRFWFDVELEPADIPVSSAPPAPPSDAFSGLRVLITDDNPTNRQLAGLILEAAGAETAFAENGRQALDALAAVPYDLILMDMMMPVMDGLEATRRLRAGEAGDSSRDLPVIMLTANTLPEHIAQSLHAGANGHLAKPITPRALLGRIAEMIAQDETAQTARSA